MCPVITHVHNLWHMTRGKTLAKSLSEENKVINNSLTDIINCPDNSVLPSTDRSPNSDNVVNNSGFGKRGNDRSGNGQHNHDWSRIPIGIR